MRYVELHSKSNFSFLRGASHPHELVERAAEIGYEGLALTDIASLAGAVRGFTPAKELGCKELGFKERGFQYIVGAEVHLSDAPALVLWPSDRAAYGRLCRLISRGRMRAEKGNCRLSWSDVVEFSQGMLAGVIPHVHEADAGVHRAEAEVHRAEAGDPQEPLPSLFEFLRGAFREAFDDRGYLLCDESLRCMLVAGEDETGIFSRRPRLVRP